MNKILLGLNAFLVLAVAFLFYKVNSIGESSSESETKKEITENKTEDSVKTTSKVDVINVATPPTGKIAFINIDVINEQSLEIADLVSELKRSKSNIEASVQALSMQYQKKMQEYEASAKAGIAPQSELEAKGREIQAIEKEAQNKQLQMDNLSMTMNEKNGAFQQGLKAFLVKWNDGRYDYILTYSDAVPTLLLGNASLDITKEVIEKVNAEYKSKKEQSKSKK